MHPLKRDARIIRIEIMVTFWYTIDQIVLICMQSCVKRVWSFVTFVWIFKYHFKFSIDVGFFQSSIFLIQKFRSVQNSQRNLQKTKAKIKIFIHSEQTTCSYTFNKSKMSWTRNEMISKFSNCKPTNIKIEYYIC